MRLSKDLIGKSVVTISDGRIVGDVKDVYMNAEMTMLAGVNLGKTGKLFRRKAVIVPIENVVVFGVDVILIKSDEAVTDSKELEVSAEWVLLDEVEGREIDTPGGTKVGQIGDLVLDEDGNIMAFALARVYVEGPLSDERVVYRDSVIDSGSKDGAMTIDLNKAELMGKSAIVAPAEESLTEDKESPAEDSASE